MTLQDAVEHHRKIAGQERFERPLHLQPVGVDAFEHDLGRQRRDPQRLDSLLVDQCGHLHHDVFRDARQRAMVRYVHLELPLVVVHESVDDGHVLLGRHLVSEQIDRPDLGIVGRLLHLFELLVLALEDALPSLRCVSSPTSTIPPFPGVQVHVIPPAAASRRVPNGHQAVHPVLMDC